jgi:uncharacterized protein
MRRSSAAFRFEWPQRGADGGLRGGGLSVSPTGWLEMVDGPAAIRQSLFLLLSTEPGERVMRPTYGCSLDHLVFGPNDETTAGLVMHYVRRAIETWESRVQLLKVNAGAHPDCPERLEIVVEYRVKTTGAADRLTYILSLADTGRR